MRRCITILRVARHSGIRSERPISERRQGTARAHTNIGMLTDTLENGGNALPGSNAHRGQANFSVLIGQD